MAASPAAIAEIQQRFKGVSHSSFRDQDRIVVPSESMFDVFSYVHRKLGFDMLIDITCVDYLNYRGARHRFGLAYIVLNTRTSERLVFRVMLDEPNLNVPSLIDIWPAANWLEREVYDMFGIQFDGHPDLRRILMPDAFTAHPLRKDYPLQGRGERHNFPVIARADA